MFHVKQILESLEEAETCADHPELQGNLCAVQRKP